MTITEKEAARILDPETSRDALWEYEEEGRLEACNEACRVAAAALRAQQTPAKLDRSRWKGCEFCKTRSCEICVNRGVYICCEDGECYGNCKYFKTARFCRRCGKPLTEEAWAELARRIGGIENAHQA